MALLGGMTGQAANALAGRGGQIDAAAGGAVPPAAAASAVPPQPTMGQAQFAGPSLSPEQKMLQQQMLIKKLRETGRL